MELNKIMFNIMKVTNIMKIDFIYNILLIYKIRKEIYKLKLE
jgi:hypothetical protein